MTSPQSSSTSMEHEILTEMQSLCHELAWGRHGQADALFELTTKKCAPDDIRELAEAFGMMLVKVEAREYRLEQVVGQLQNKTRELEQARKTLAKQNKALKSSLRKEFSPGRIIGQGPAMRSIIEQVKRVASTPVNVLVTGESGTGKEVIAKTIHFHSERSPNPFIAINCSAIPEELFESQLFGIEKNIATGVDKQQGLFAQANTGTLFLDEIGELSPALQTKLLRVIEERQVTSVGGRQSLDLDIKLVTATNKNLRDEVDAGRFRLDLFYRLNVINFHLPPLRERTEDIPALARLFLDRHTRIMGREPMMLTKAALEILTHYTWPGNIRELNNEMERAVALARDAAITPEDLTDHICACVPGTVSAFESSSISDLSLNLEEVERHLIAKALRTTGNNKSQAAKLLGVSREGLRKKMKRQEM